MNRGLTQEQLAERVGCAWETISKIERGKNPPSVKVLYDLAKALNVSINDLVGEVGRTVSLTRLGVETRATALLRTLDDDLLLTALRLLEALNGQESK